jgi:gamma-glutamyl hercynylcysteine S-oxide synthase
MSSTLTKLSAEALVEALQEARTRTLELVADLNDEQMIGPPLQIVNPLRWETGHIAWFQEFWVLRHLGKQTPILKHGDELYDSARVAHDTRWDLPLLTMDETLSYMQQVLERIIDQTRRAHEEPAGIMRGVGGYDESYFLKLALFHEQMHDEAITYTRQTLGYPSPDISLVVVQDDYGPVFEQGQSVKPSTNFTQADGLNCATGDAQIPGGEFMLGSNPDEGFVFDNEHWAHEVEVAPFAISKTALTNGEFKNFVEDAGYRRSELWTAEGWQWRSSVGAEHPVYWRREGSGRRWLRRNFDKWVPLEERLPVIHVNWHEADAYCRWAGKRLPTEAEWELAASGERRTEPHSNKVRKRTFPWGDEAPTPERANLDWHAMGCVPVDALPDGDSAFGCRQMIGNVWEWTATDFGPYPGFAPGPYKEYSQPWFGDHKVLRGGCWVTRSRLIRNAYRNFYRPDRRDVWAGFRTCAL